MEPVDIENLETTEVDNTLDYTWDQDFDFLTIKIPISEEVTKKDIQVLFSAEYLKIFVKDKKLEGEFYKKIKVEESSWYLETMKNGKNLIIEIAHLTTKDDTGLSAKCFVFETEVYSGRKNFKSIDRKLSEFSPEYQMKTMKRYLNGIEEMYT